MLTAFDKSVTVTKLSITAPRLEMISSDNRVAAIGSGAFFKGAAGFHVVTNWHNLSGLNPVTGACLSRMEDIPVRIRVIGRRMRDAMVNVPQVFELDLFDDQAGALAWREHRDFGRRVDVGAIRVPDEFADGLVGCNEDLFTYPVIKSPGDEIFVLGYPLNISGGLNYPLWKRGSIASEPSEDIDGLPKYLIDTASRKGMSGAPVYFRSHIHLTEDSKLAVGNTAQIFYGIYSGRLPESGDSASDPIAAQIGIVWKPRTVGEVVAHGVAPRL